VKISLANQLMCAALSLALGAAAGLLYDVLHEMRTMFRSVLISALMDILFWMVCIAAVFMLAMTAGQGELRIYMVAGIAGGGAIYLSTVSRAVRTILRRVTRAVKRAIAAPAAYAARQTKKSAKIAKNIFQLKKNYCTMKLSISRQDARDKRRAKDGGENDLKEKKIRLHTQAVRGGFRGIRGEHAGLAADGHRPRAGSDRGAQDGDRGTGADQRRTKTIVGN